jgi:uncharacterized protein YggE
MTAVLQALAAAGFSGPDIATQSITIVPRYEQRPSERPRIVGYEATNQVRVTTREIARLGPALDAAVQAGANVSGGLAFSLHDPHPVELEALRRAVRDAQERLLAMLDALGKKLIRVVEVRTLDLVRPGPVYGEAAGLARAMAPTPVEPGQLTVRARVVVRAEFE